jgi:hypothetical protein
VDGILDTEKMFYPKSRYAISTLICMLQSTQNITVKKDADLAHKLKDTLRANSQN